MRVYDAESLCLDLNSYPYVKCAAMQITHAPAKINLALHITGQRADGYHLLDTIAVFADTIYASDTIIIGRAAGDGFSISGPFGEKLKANASDDNLIMCARSRKTAIRRHHQCISALSNAYPLQQVSVVDRRMRRRRSRRSIAIGMWAITRKSRAPMYWPSSWALMCRCV